MYVYDGATACRANTLINLDDDGSVEVEKIFRSMKRMGLIMNKTKVDSHSSGPNWEMDPTTTSVEILEALFSKNLIKLRRGQLFDSRPATMPNDFDFDRVEGMLLGLAIGDSLGRTCEGMSPTERQRRHGLIRDYLPHPSSQMQPLGAPSDDTQMAFWTLEHLLEHRRLVPEKLAGLFCARKIFGIGSTVREFIRNFKDWDQPWYKSGPNSAGNGALMRIAPLLVPYLRAPDPALWADTALAAMLTHNNSMSTGSCLAFVKMLWDLLSMKDPPDRDWWIRTFVEILKPLEDDEVYRTRTPHIQFSGSLSTFMEENIRDALERNLPALEACDRWYSGAFLLETVPSAIYILSLHADEPEEAIIRAVNDTRDNDTVAAIVGAAVGALHGRKALPERWIENLLGRTQQDDDGQVFQLISEAKRTWGP